MFLRNLGLILSIFIVGLGLTSSEAATLGQLRTLTLRQDALRKAPMNKVATLKSPFGRLFTNAKPASALNLSLKGPMTVGRSFLSRPASLLQMQRKPSLLSMSKLGPRGASVPTISRPVSPVRAQNRLLSRAVTPVSKVAQKPALASVSRLGQQRASVSTISRPVSPVRASNRVLARAVTPLSKVAQNPVLASASKVIAQKPVLSPITPRTEQRSSLSLLSALRKPVVAVIPQPSERPLLERPIPALRRLAALVSHVLPRPVSPPQPPRENPVALHQPPQENPAVLAQQRQQAERERTNVTVRGRFTHLKANDKRFHIVADVFSLMTAEEEQEIVANILNRVMTRMMDNTQVNIDLGLKQEALKKQCLKNMRRNPSAATLDAMEKIECAERAAALVQAGQSPNILTAVGRAVSSFAQKTQYRVSWEEAENMGNFIRNTGLHDKNLAKRYYDLAIRLFNEDGWGTSVQENRENLALILLNDEGVDPRKTTDPAAYAEDQLTLLLAAVQVERLTPEQHFARQKRQRLRDAFLAEGLLRAQNYARVHQRIIDESNGNHIRFDKNDGQGLRQVPLIDETQAIFNELTNLQDAANQRRGLRFNYIYFGADPNLAYCMDADRTIPAVTSVLEIRTIFDQLMAAYEDNPGIDRATYAENITNALLTALDDSGDEANRVKRARLRARMMRAYGTLTVGANAFDPTPVIARRRFGVFLAENELTRCDDGIDEWLTDLEIREIYRAPKHMGFSVFVSQLVNQRKSDVLNMHKPPATLPAYDLRHAFNPAELGTTGALLLKQRTRLGFSLPIPASPVHHPLEAGTTGRTAQIYDPVRFVRRFFSGGQLIYSQRDITQIGEPEVARGAVDIPAFTHDSLVDLVRTAWLRNILRDEVLEAEIAKDWTLVQARTRVYVDGTEQENAYFRNEVAKDRKYKPAVFKRLLCRSGFLIDEAEPAFDPH